MSVSYLKLWKLLIDKRMRKSQLRDAAGISTNAIAKLGKNETVSLGTLEKICVALNCNIEDAIKTDQIAAVVPDGNTIRIKTGTWKDHPCACFYS